MKQRPSVFERLAQRSKTHSWDTPLGIHNECWTWQGSRDAKGYGFVSVDGQCRRVHVVAWRLSRGESPTRPMPKGWTLDHTCRNPSCWRPSHLVRMTRSKNTALGNRANPRDPTKARAAKKRRGIEVVVHNGAFIREAIQDAAARIMAAGRVETVSPITPRDGEPG